MAWDKWQSSGIHCGARQAETRAEWALETIVEVEVKAWQRQLGI